MSDHGAPEGSEAEALRRDAGSYRALAQGCEESLVLLDPEGRVLEANPAAETLLGAPAAELLGRPLLERLHASDRDGWRRSLHELIEDPALGRTHVTSRVRRAARTPSAAAAPQRSVDWTFLPVRDERGRPRSIVALGRDVTEPRAAQQEIEAVRRCLAAIGESASILAHEIKNPITALHVALRAVASEIGEDPAEVLQDFERRLHRLERLLRRTLEYTRPLRPQLRRTSVEELVDGPVRRLAGALEERGARCEVVVPSATPPVMADKALVGEALTSLLENSLDALASGGRVRVTSRVEGPTVVLSVEDDGPGLTEAARESLFQPFHTTRKDGAGLGLALGRRIAEAHGGALEPAEGSLGGACFQLKLPVAERSDAEPSPERT